MADDNLCDTFDGTQCGTDCNEDSHCVYRCKVMGQVCDSMNGDGDGDDTKMSQNARVAEAHMGRMKAGSYGSSHDASSSHSQSSGAAADAVSQSDDSEDESGWTPMDNAPF